MKRTSMLVVGSINMDLIASTERFPGSGETVFGKRFSTAPGGKGANQAVQLARIGANVTLIGKIGRDAFGKQMLETIGNEGIDTSRIMTDEQEATGTAVILLEEHPNAKTQNRILVLPGTNRKITVEDVAFLQEDIQKYDMVLLQHEVSMEVNYAVARFAKAKNVPVMLNPAPSAIVNSEMLSGLTYISPNEHEAYDLTGIQIRKDGSKVNKDDVREASDVFLKKGVTNVLITLGNAGAAFVNDHDFIISPCIEQMPVVDPTAAGDSFIAAFCAAVSSGMSETEALRFANYTAGITVSRLGAQPSLPRLSEVEEAMTIYK